ncbi:MAG TPA: FtsH protease activity modulator HflK [Stellaceae bacterium]|nr:FtsH protease activity modulator HflK [Stellaceae bacterium]
MPWTNQGGGGGGGPWGGGQSPWGRGPQGPKVEDIIKRSQDRLRGLLPGGFGSAPGVIIVLAIVLLLWLASGFYRVLPDEEGIVLRFGAFERRAFPGLNYHLPSPIETVYTPKVTRVNRLDVGYRPSERAQNRVPQVPEEALMLTGDENIVDINFFVLWRIKEAKDYLFNIADPEQTVKAAAESAMREVIGHTDIAKALAPGRAAIEQEAQKLLQDMLDSYHSGIEVTELRLEKVDPPPQVIDSFRDVQSAKIDYTRLQNEADAYQNDVVPRAQGDAARLVQEAEAYKQQVVKQAEGDAQRFISVYNAYKQAPDITARRLYIETMQDVLKNSNKIILDRAATASGVVPYLPLPELKPGKTTAGSTTVAPAPRVPTSPGVSSRGTQP